MPNKSKTKRIVYSFSNLQKIKVSLYLMLSSIKKIKKKSKLINLVGLILIAREKKHNKIKKRIRIRVKVA